MIAHEPTTTLTLMNKKQIYITMAKQEFLPSYLQSRTETARVK